MGLREADTLVSDGEQSNNVQIAAAERDESVNSRDADIDADATAVSAATALPNIG